MDKILVVDDLEQNVELISRYLINAGYEVITANNGATAIKKAKIMMPDLIILDIMMPQVSGYDVCKILKSTENTKYISILIVTALDSKDMRTRALEVGADDFITKSFDKTTLLSRVKSLLRIKHLSDKLKEQYKELEHKNSILDMQLKMARQVQRSLIQESNFCVNDVSFNSRYMPAQDVGGDLYDILQLDNDNIGVFVSDVSGHGISASLLTSMLKFMFRNLAPNYEEPKDLLHMLNKEFANIFANKTTSIYVAASYAKINTKAKIMTYANAGMPHPLYINSKLADKTIEIDANGIPIGMVDDSKYEQCKLSFGDNDLCLFYTDGLSDLLYKDNNEEFLSQLKELLYSYNTQPSEEIIQQILSQFYNNDDNSKLENDDVSIILCRMNCK